LYAQLLVLLCLSLPPTDSCSEKNHPDDSEFKILPLGFYTPETRIAAGVMAYYSFGKKTQDSSVAKKSNIQLYLSYTQNRQYGVETDWQVFSKKETSIHQGSFDFVKFPEYFFGIGNLTEKGNKESYSFDRIRLTTKNIFRLRKNIYAGLNMNFQYLFDLTMTNPRLMNCKTIPGAEGFRVNGFGPSVVFDSRNNALNATQGSYFELSNTVYNQYTLSQFQYYNVTINYRKYNTFGKITWANDLYFNFNKGTLPFRMLPAIGGARFLRGYYTGRFRDKNLFILQTEVRRELIWRLGIVLFGGVGQVASSLSDFQYEHLKYSYGGGLRFKISKKDNTNLRIDYGITNESTGLYIIFAEAF
jgi:outer membrane protein assembly factor BamA